MFAPAGVAPAIVEKLNKAINQVMAMPEVRERLLAAGAQPLSGSPQALADHVASEIERWAAVVKASNAKID